MLSCTEASCMRDAFDAADTCAGLLGGAVDQVVVVLFASGRNVPGM